MAKKTGEKHHGFPVSDVAEKNQAKDEQNIETFWPNDG